MNNLTSLEEWYLRGPDFVRWPVSGQQLPNMKVLKNLQEKGMVTISNDTLGPYYKLTSKGLKIKESL